MSGKKNCSTIPGGAENDCPRKWAKLDGWKSTRCSPRFAPRWIFERALGPVFVLVHLGRGGSKSLRKRLFDCWVNTRSSHGNLFVYANGQSTVAPPLRPSRLPVSLRVSAINCFSSRLRRPLCPPPLPLVEKITPPLLEEGRPIPPTKRKTDSAAAIDR